MHRRLLQHRKHGAQLGPYSTSLTWETIVNKGVGVDFTLFGNRLTGSFDWYERTTKDMIGPAQSLSALYGAAAPRTNNAELRTRGWEVELTWRDHIGKFNYSISANLSDYKSIITKYYSPTNQCFGESANVRNGNYWYEGKELGEIWGYHVVGIAKSDDEMNNYLSNVSQSSIGSNWGGGDLMYTDLNGDGKVDAGSATLNDHVDNASFNLKANRAYLHSEGSGVKGFVIDFDDNATGIETMISGQSSMVNEIYNLAGQRLQKAQKGININNGKKILK